MPRLNEGVAADTVRGNQSGLAGTLALPSLVARAQTQDPLLAVDEDPDGIGFDLQTTDGDAARRAGHYACLLYTSRCV